VVFWNPRRPEKKNSLPASLFKLFFKTMADEDLIDYNEEEEQTEIVAEKESKK